MHNYSTRLFDTPFYRDTAGGALDPTIQYSVNKAREYHTKAPQIREMRFAKSSAFDADFAIRNQKERDISTLYASGADPLDMQGAHARMKLTGTQTGGALASYLKGGPQVNFTDMDGHVRSSNLGFDNHPVSQKTRAYRASERASKASQFARAVAKQAGNTETTAEANSFLGSFGDYDNDADETVEQMADWYNKKIPIYARPAEKKSGVLSAGGGAGLPKVHLAPLLDFHGMNPNERRQYRTAIIVARRQGLAPGSADFNKFMAKTLRKMKTNQFLRKDAGAPLGALAVSPRKSRSGHDRGDGVRSERTSASVRAPLNERTATLATPKKTDAGKSYTTPDRSTWRNAR